MSRSARTPNVRRSVAAACLLLLAACGGNADPDSSGSPAPTVAGATEDRAGEDIEEIPENSDGVGSSGDENATATADSSASGSSASGSSVSGSSGTSSGDDGEPSDTVPVTIEPPRAAPVTLPPSTVACEGPGFGEVDGLTTTRIGVLVPDYSALIDTGFVPRVTPIEYQTRYLASTFGANVRNETIFSGSPFALPCGELELVLETYDPLDPATQRDACIALAEDPGVLVVLSEVEDRRGDAITCLTEEAGIPVLAAGAVTSTDLAAADGRLVSLRPPADLLGASAARTFAAMQLLEDQKVAVLGGDGVVTSAAAEAVLEELDALGVPAISVVLPDQKGVTDVWAEIPEVAADLASQEVTVVISVFDAVVTNALWDRMIEQGASWQYLLVDAMGVAEHDEVTRLPDEFAGIVVTSIESEKEAERTDPASVECIADYANLVVLLETDPEASGMLGHVPDFQLPDSVVAGEPNESVTPATTIVPEESADTPGVADETSDSADGTSADETSADEDGGEDTDDGIETSLREVLGEDRPPGPACALASTAIRAILAAGEDLTAGTFTDALHSLGPIDLFIEGSGSLSPDKFYVVDFVHALSFIRFEEPISEELVAPCDSPDNCWRAIDDPAAARSPLVPTPGSGTESSDSESSDSESSDSENPD